MKFRTNDLVSLLACFALSCSQHPPILKNGIAVKYKDDSSFYHYLEIGNTGYYVYGEGRSKFLAEIDAQGHLRSMNEVIRPTLSDLEEVDGDYRLSGKMERIIEPKEYEKLMIIRALRNIEDSASK